MKCDMSKLLTKTTKERFAVRKVTVDSQVMPFDTTPTRMICIVSVPKEKMNNAESKI